MANAQCPLHGLPTASDGKCARCQRTPSSWPAPASLPPPPPRHQGLVPLALVLSACVAALGFCVWAMVARSVNDVPGDAPAREGIARSATSFPPASATLSARRAERAVPRPPRPPRIDRDVTTPTASEPVQEELADPESPEASPPTDAEVAQAFRRVSMTVYVTQTCPVCRRAQTWLSANNIPHRAVDVRIDPRAREQMERLNPRGSVPTFDIDGTVLVGFGERTVSRTLARAAEKHLRELTGKNVQLEVQ